MTDIKLKTVYFWTSSPSTFVDRQFLVIVQFNFFGSWNIGLEKSRSSEISSVSGSNLSIFWPNLMATLIKHQQYSIEFFIIQRKIKMVHLDLWPPTLNLTQIDNILLNARIRLFLIENRAFWWTIDHFRPYLLIFRNEKLPCIICCVEKTIKTDNSV